MKLINKNPMEKLNEQLKKDQHRVPITFDDYLDHIAKEPQIILRNTFQLFSDFIHHYIPKGVDEYSDDPESIKFVYYDCNDLLVEGTDNPFFADRLFANKLVTLADSLKRGAQQNKKYLFIGPHGSGKSTFLNNLFRKLEGYTRIPEGLTYETIWKIDKKKLGWKPKELEDILKEGYSAEPSKKGKQKNDVNNSYLEIPCPSHDYPFLIIPKEYRREFFDELIKDEDFKEKLFNDKEYDWVFKKQPCTICSSIYTALSEKLNSPDELLKMLFVRKNHFDRRLGEGITIYNAGDVPPMTCVITNDAIQKQLAEIFGDSRKVRYLFSRYAKTNNGVYALMDIKDHNVKRLMGLHGIISEGLHKVDDLEENIDSLFISVINPEDKIDIDNEKMQAFSDRLEYTKLPYVQAYDTEVEIYKSIFGDKIEEKFLPRVLNNFAKVIISTRLDRKSPILDLWVKDADKYSSYCSSDLLLLKMELYTGYIPPWITEEDRKNFTADIRRDLIKESENEGFRGISGRKSIDIFDEFYSMCTKGNQLIDMAMLQEFFKKKEKELNGPLSAEEDENKEKSALDRIFPQHKTEDGSLSHPDFLESLVNLYDYNLVQEIKESLYYYNKVKISLDIQHYLFAINFTTENEEGQELFEKVKCPWTGKILELDEKYLNEFEKKIFGSNSPSDQMLNFRKSVQNEYVTRTLTQEMQIQGKDITDTELYKSLVDKYNYKLKENALDPFINNDNFRNAIKEFKTKEFSTYDTKIQEDVTYLINNLQNKYGYTESGAKQVCLYTIDKDLAKKF